jgi:hypothetical protein
MSNEKTMDFSHNFTSGLHAVMKKKHYYFKKFPAKLAAKALRGTNKVE